jgi:hypothetical protein
VETEINDPVAGSTVRTGALEFYSPPVVIHPGPVRENIDRPLRVLAADRGSAVAGIVRPWIKDEPTSRP